ncbi:MAG: hypothetical protein ABI844_03325 [Saprospiraceae bacterium]
MSTRRSFLSTSSKAALLAYTPLSLTQFQKFDLSQDTIIDNIEILKVTGPYTSIPGANRQYQVQPIHIYPAQRPAPYTDRMVLKETTGTITHYFVQIRTKGGLTGLYGAIEPECNYAILNQLKPLLIGKDALAIEANWDMMYRSNRHARAGHFMSRTFL